MIGLAPTGKHSGGENIRFFERSYWHRLYTTLPLKTYRKHNDLAAEHDNEIATWSDCERDLKGFTEGLGELKFRESHGEGDSRRRAPFVIGWHLPKPGLFFCGDG